MEIAGLAVDGVEAFELIKLHNPHILITDIKMPGMNGLDLAKKVV